LQNNSDGLINDEQNYKIQSTSTFRSDFQRNVNRPFIGISSIINTGSNSDTNFYFTTHGNSHSTDTTAQFIDTGINSNATSDWYTLTLENVRFTNSVTLKLSSYAQSKTATTTIICDNITTPLVASGDSKTRLFLHLQRIAFNSTNARLQFGSINFYTQPLY